jgi:hypothetical protein
MREHTLPLLFAALAAGLCLFERRKLQRAEAEMDAANIVDKKATQAAPRFHP